MKWRLWIMVCVVVSAHSAGVLAQEQPPLPERVCPVSDDRFKRAQAIFAKIAEVLRQPRCIKCHGAENPFAKNTTHTGGTYELKRDKAGDVEEKATFNACQQCHGALPDWRTPTGDMNFIDLDDTGLCKLIKNQLVRGDNLIDHFTRDLGGTPFIEEAFQGTRGLNAEGRSMVDDDPSPIRIITHKGLIKLARDWVDAIGTGNDTIGDGDTRPATDCGCVQHHYALRIHSETTVVAGPVTADSRANGPDPLIPITFNDDRSFGSKDVKVAMPVKITGPPPCVAGGISAISFSASGNFTDQGESQLQIKGLGKPQGTESSVVCPSPLPSAAGGSVGNPASLDFVLQPIVGAQSPTQPVPWMRSLPMVHSAVSIAIVKTD